MRLVFVLVLRRPQLGIYHFHSTPGCLQEHAMVVAGATRLEHSPQLGWAYVSFDRPGWVGGVRVTVWCGLAWDK